MKLQVVLNATSGSLIDRPLEPLVHEVRSRFEAAGADAYVMAASGSAIVQAMHHAMAAPADAIVVGGGDGTIATAAGLLMGTDKALGVLPLGTLNLLARDLGVPLELGAAIPALAAGHIREIDTAEVNGRVFLCNSVLGIMPAVTKHRERQRGQPFWPRWRWMALAALRAFYRYRDITVDIDVGLGPRRIRTHALVVTNNGYDDRSARFLARSSLTRGELALYLARSRTRLGMLRLAYELWRGTWQEDETIESIMVKEVRIGSRRRRLRVASDGEVHLEKPPLVYRIRPRALKVLVPAGSPADLKP